jgi:hypothetical protein
MHLNLRESADISLFIFSSVLSVPSVVEPILYPLGTGSGVVWKALRDAEKQAISATCIAAPQA